MELAHYAWVTAALAEGYSLDEVLSLEGLEPPAWEHAELSWRTRLATDLDIHADYRSYLGTAEDALGGEVTPLGDDLESWVIFLRIYGDHSAPFELLAEQKLRPGDLARLHRKWARRLEEDEGLVKKADKLRKKTASRAEDGEELPLPAVVVTPGSLHASPYARDLPPEQNAAQAAGAPPEARRSAPGEPQLSLYDYAALCAALDDKGADRKAVLEAYGMSPTDGDRLDRAWRAKMDADPTLATDFRTLHRHFNEREAIRGEAMPAHDYIPAGAAAGPSFSPVVVPAGAVPRSSPPPGPAPGVPRSSPPAGAPPGVPAASPHPGPARGAPPPTPAQPPGPGPVQAPAIGYNPSLGMTMGVGANVPVVDLPFGGKRSSDSAKEKAKASEAEQPSSAAEPKSKPAAPPGQAKAKKHDPHPEMGATALPGAKLPKITLPFKARSIAGSDEAAAKASPATPAPSAQPSSLAASPASAAAKPKKHDPHPEMGATALPGAKLPKITLPFKAKPEPSSDKDSAPPPAKGQPAAGAQTGAAKPAAEPPQTSQPSPKPAAAEHPDFGATVGLGDHVPIVDLPFREKLRAEVARRKAAAAGVQPASKQESPAGAGPTPSSPPGRAGATPSSPPGRAGATPSSPPPNPQLQPSGSNSAGAPPAASDVANQIAGWEVHHYASLCAELAEHPDHVAAIRSRYGLPDQAAEAYVHEVWQMRFIEDVDARQEWQRLLKQYRGAIAKKK